MGVTFEWDESKALLNERKHGVTFDEAVTIFGDPFSITIADSEHSDAEDRFIDIGESGAGHLLVVAYTERGGAIRIISCRMATSAERRAYEQQRT